jgi:hypothetical protein
MKIKSFGLIPALICAASLGLQANAQRPGGLPPRLTGSGGPVLTGSGNPPPPPPWVSGSGNPPPPFVSGSGPALFGSGNPPPPWVSGSNPALSGSGNPPPPQLSSSGNPPPPQFSGSGPALSGSNPIVTGSCNTPPPWSDPLHGGSLESLTLRVTFVPTSGTTTTATGVLQAVSFSGTDHGTLAVRTSGLSAGAYTVSAVIDSSTTPVTLGTFNVHNPVTTGTATPRPHWTQAGFGGPRGIPFPDGLDPFTIASLAISDSNANVLFTADLTTVTDGVYFASTPLVSGTSVPDAAGSAQIHANAKAGVVSGVLIVNAHGLQDSTTYTYAINGTDINTITTGTAGSLHLMATENATTGTLPGTVNLFNVTAVTIHDGSGNIILSASF